MKLKPVHILEMLLVAAVIGGSLYYSNPNIFESKKYRQIKHTQLAFEQLCDVLQQDPVLLETIISQHTRGFHSVGEYVLKQTNVAGKVFEVDKPIPFNTIARSVIKDDSLFLNESWNKYNLMCYKKEKRELGQQEVERTYYYFAVYTNDLLDPYQKPINTNRSVNLINVATTKENYTLFDISNGINSHGCIYVDGSITINNQ